MNHQLTFALLYCGTATRAFLCAFLQPCPIQFHLFMLDQHLCYILLAVLSLQTTPFVGINGLTRITLQHLGRSGRFARGDWTMPKNAVSTAKSYQPTDTHHVFRQFKQKEKSHEEQTRSRLQPAPSSSSSGLAMDGRGTGAWQVLTGHLTMLGSKRCQQRP